jgi:alpha-tubulin suppressor-like RCC1 family protein/rRNA maturation protein Nop10
MKVRKSVFSRDIILSLILLFCLFLPAEVFSQQRNSSASGRNRYNEQYQRIEAGENHTIEIRGGQLWAWGKNTNGQLGDGSITDRLNPVRIGVDSTWISISSRGNHTLGIKSNGTLWAWGLNDEGQLGDGTLTNRNTPVQIGSSTNWVSVECGTSYSMAIQSNGTLWAWGWNGAGQLGNGTTNNQSTPIQIGSGTDWMAVSAGYWHTMAIKSNGTLWGWGKNDVGQIGDGTFVDKTSPVQIGTGNSWRNISVGEGHSIALRSNGTLWAWGWNAFSQVGNGNTTNQNAPLQIGSATDWQSITAGGYHSLALKASGQLWSWGRNNNGQLGDGSTTQSSAPIQIGTSTVWTSISAGSLFSLSSQANGTAWAWGINSSGQIGDGTTVQRNSPVQISTITNWVMFSGGDAHTLGIKSNGTLWSWGRNFNGQLGDGTTTDRNNPVQIGTDNDWVMVSTGQNFSMALKSNGTLWGWGYNSDGQLGDGSTTQRNSPVQVGSANDWVFISSGNAYNLALKSNGTLWAWGINSLGQLGSGNTNSSSSPIQIGIANNWVSVNCGAVHSLGRRADGTLWSWGYNANGQLGHGNTTNRTSPLQVGLQSDWISVSAGASHTVALKSNGTIWAWGNNSYGDLGIGNTTQQNSPVQIGTGSDWKSINGGFSYYSMGIKTDGTLWTWGYNGNGQLGDGSTSNKTSPQQIGTETHWIFVESGGYHSGAIQANRNSICMTGANSSGQLGNGTVQGRTSFGCDVPAVIPQLSVTVTSNHPVCVGQTLSLTASETPGAAYAWAGPNGYTANTRIISLSNATTAMSGVYTVTATRNTETATATETVSVNPNIGTNTISGNQSLPLPGTPAMLTGSLPSGGNGSYTYVWQSSINQTTWSSLGSGNPNLNPDSINQTTYYRRIVSAGPCAASTSNTIMVSVLSWQKVSLGYYHALAIRSDGTLWSWGENTYGQLGLGDNINRTSPVQIGTDNNWVNISTGDEFNMAIRSNGTLWAWGHNWSGQLGLGISGNQNVPVQVGIATNWSSVSPGREFCLGLRTDGTLWSWGNNQMGQLGTGNTLYRNTPGQVGSATDWVAVSAADFHSIAIRSNGTLWSWGANGNGQLGLNDYVNRNTPTQIGSGTNWVKISSRTRQNFAIRTDGTLWAWGEGGYYTLGNGNPNDQVNPVQIGTDSDWASIAAGYYQTLALKTNGSLWVWGMNNNGELGDTTNVDKITPIQIGAGNNHIWAAAGWRYSAIIRAPGQTICTTGANDIGQLGNGTTQNQNYFSCDIGINPPPPLILYTTSNDPVCEGQTLSLSANNTPGATYAWSGPNGFTANTRTISLSNSTPSMSGVYTVTATLNSNSLTTTHTVSVEGAIGSNAIGNAQTLCAPGFPSLLTGSSPTGGDGYFTFIWETSTNNISWGVHSGSGQDLTPDSISTNTHYRRVVSSSTCAAHTSMSVLVSINSLPEWTVVKSGGVSSMGIKSDGTLWAWGDNTYGQLGDGTQTRRTTPVQIGMSTNWVSIFPGAFHSFGIKSDGTLWGWGYNATGSLGDGTNTQRLSPVQIGSDNNWQSVSPGTQYSLGVKTDGSLWAWGRNTNRQLGDGTTTDTNVPIRIGTDNNWMSVSARGSSSLALRTNGTLWAWGQNSSGQLGNGTTNNITIPTQIGSATDWSQLSGGSDYTLAIKSNGTFWAWGGNFSGQLGDGTTTQRTSPVQIGTATDWLTVSASISGAHSFGIKTNGTLWAWGTNTEGQFGNGTTTQSTSPIQIGTGTNWSSISTGQQHTLGLQTNRQYICGTGRNNDGQLGIGTLVLRSNFLCDVPAFNLSVSVSSNTPVCAGSTLTLTASETTCTSYSWSGPNGFTANTRTISLSNATTNMSGVYTVTATLNSNTVTATHTVTVGGTIGSNTIGDAQTLCGVGSPATITGSAPTGGSGSYTFVWETSSNNSTWGTQAGSGQDLSPGSISASTYYRRVVSSTVCASSTSMSVLVSINSLPEWTTVADGIGHSLGIKSDGTLWAWGNNLYGQLGNGTNTNTTTPIQVGSDRNWLSISAGSYHSVAIKTDGTLWAWGNNAQGKLGDGTTTNRNSPIQIGTAANWMNVSAGSTHTHAIKSDGTLWAWGGNGSGQLGDGTTTSRTTPVQIGIATNWLSVSAGGTHTHAIKSDGTLWAWGNNGQGRLGDGTTTNRTAPIQIGTDTNWSSITVGTNHTNALKSNGTLWSWGFNANGQLGDGSTTSRSVPVQIGSATNWTSVSAGGSHALALKSDGTLWAWGANHWGQLGDGTTTNRTSPIQIGIATNWIMVSGGDSHSLAIQSNRQQVCGSGMNTDGNLGNGSTASQSSFTCSAPAFTLSVGVTSNAPICAGSTLTLTASETTCTSYSWSGPNGFTANTRTISLSNATTNMSGVYTVTATLSSNTTTVTHTVSVDSPSVSISPSGTINTCAGNTTLLTASGASTYLWSNSATTNTINVTTDGTYTVTGTDGNGCSTTAAVVTVQSYPVLSGNTLTSNQTICSGQTPAAFTGSLASGGNGSYSYQWQSSGDNSTWTDASGVTSQDYSAPLPSNNTYYRRLLSSGNCSVISSASVSITRLFAIGNNTIGDDQTICAAGVPANLTGTSPTGGNGIYTFVWETSSNNSTWATHTGSGMNLTPAYISNSTYYRRVVSSTGCPSDNSMVTTVTRLIGQNDIASSQTINYNTAPATIIGQTNLNSPGYAWETSYNNFNWVAISGANTSVYAPSALIQHAWYRRKVAGPGCTDTLVSTPVKITLNMVTSNQLTATTVSPVCAGAPVYLNSLGPAGSTYLWSGPNGYTSSQQNPSLSNSTESLSGIYRVRITKLNGDIDSATVNVVVGPSLGNFQLLFNNPVCAGNTLALSASNLPRVEYTWAGPNSFTSASAVNSFGNAQPSLSGVYSLTATSPGCQSISRTILVTVNAALNPNPGSNGPICQTNILNLTSTTRLGASYAWTGPNGFTSAIQNPSIANAQTVNSGIYTLTMSGLGCSNVTQTHTVLVNASIGSLSVSSNSPVCLGNTLTLSIPSYVNATYSWLGPNGFTGSNANVMNRSNAQTNFSGIYTLTAIVPGCGSFTRVSTVSVLPSISVTVGSNSPRCRGQVLNLNATTLTSATYSWSGPSGFTSSLQNPSIGSAQTHQSGVYTLTISLPGCGSGVFTTNVAINQPFYSPLGGVMSGNSPVCAGNTLTITTLNQPNASSYNWTGPAGFVGSGTTVSRANAQTNFAGDYIVTITVPGCGTARATYKAVVLGGNTVIASANTPTCEGSVLYLSSNTIIGANYVWSGPNGFTSSLQNPVLTNVQPNQSGIYTVTTTQGSCGTSSSTLSVLVSLRPSSAQVSAAQTICTPGALTLTGTDVAGATLSWAGPSGFTASGSTFTIPTTTLASGGTYTYTVATTACGTATRNVNVAVLSGTQVSGTVYPNPICTGAPLYMQSGFINGAIYNWSGPSGFSVNAQNASRNQVTNLMAGVYTLTVNVPGCGAITQNYTLVVNTCRNASEETESTEEVAVVEELKSFSLEVYPNPTEGMTTVTLTGVQTEDTDLAVYDLLGHQVLVSGKVTLSSGSKSWELDFRGIAKGVYFVKLNTEAGEKVERIVVR